MSNTPNNKDTPNNHFNSQSSDADFITTVILVIVRFTNEKNIEPISVITIPSEKGEIIKVNLNKKTIDQMN